MQKILLSFIVLAVAIATTAGVGIHLGMTVEGWKLVVDLLKVLVWPSAIIWATWYYRDDIRKLAERVIEAGPAKLVLAPSQTSVTQQETAPVGGPSPSAPSLPRTSGTIDYKEGIAKIRAVTSTEELEKIVSEIKAVFPVDESNETAEKIEFLIHANATLWAQLAHERVYRLIFGSQLRLMLSLNTAGGLTTVQVREQYDIAAGQFPQLYANSTFEQWIGYLTGQSQVTVDQQGNYHLTPEGRGLLRYIIDWKLPPEKPF